MRTTLATLALFSLLCGGCSMGKHRMTKDLASLAQETRMGGEFIMEVAEDGTVVTAEAELSPDQLPKACLDAAEKLVPGGRIVGAEKEFAEGRMLYEVVKQVGQKRTELLMLEDGTLEGREDSLNPAEVPPGVVEAARNRVGNGQLVVVERVSGPEALAGEAYHVKMRVQGEVLRISVTEDYRVVKVVRKMKAEVRVPYK